MGICAGAYFAGNYVDFAQGTDIEVLGNRELGFFPGAVIGPNLAPFDYTCASGARAAKVGNSTVYYNGGGYFAGADGIAGVEVLGRYEDGKAAIVSCRVGLGRAILSGVHFEYDPELLCLEDPQHREILPELRAGNRERIELIKWLLNLKA